MKFKTLFQLAVFIAGAGLLASCQAPQSVCCEPAGAATSAAIVAHPRELTFPPFEFHPPKADPYRVQLQSGPVAYIASDHELPLVTIGISIHTGDWVEPEGKEGLTDFYGGLLTRGGTESRSAQELEERLAFLAANLGSSIRGAGGSVSLNLLSKDLDEGMEILREVLTQPRFQQDRLELQKQQALQAIKQRNDDSSTIEGFESDYLAYGEKFWDNRYQTAASIESISREDLLAFHKRWFFPSNFVVTASGDFDRDAMIQKLEKLFSNWPWTDAPPPAIPQNIVMANPGIYIVDKEVNQGRVTMLLPGIMRDNPDYFPVIIMNDILGGGGFTSRLVNRIRSDEGLAYSVGSSFPGGVYFPYAFRAAFQSKSGTVAYASEIVIEELKRIAAEPVSTEELENSKRGFIDRLPRNFSSKAQTVGVLAGEEFTGRYQTNPEYWQTVAAKLNAVTKEDVQRVARKYLVPEKLVILVVGNKDDILKGHPNHPVKLSDLGKVTELPLRDPMTMKPMVKETASAQ